MPDIPILSDNVNRSIVLCDHAKCDGRQCPHFKKCQLDSHLHPNAERLAAYEKKPAPSNNPKNVPQAQARIVNRRARMGYPSPYRKAFDECKNADCGEHYHPAHQYTKPTIGCALAIWTEDSAEEAGKAGMDPVTQSLKDSAEEALGAKDAREELEAESGTETCCSQACAHAPAPPARAATAPVAAPAGPEANPIKAPTDTNTAADNAPPADSAEADSATVKVATPTKATATPPPHPQPTTSSGETTHTTTPTSATADNSTPASMAEAAGATTGGTPPAAPQPSPSANPFPRGGGTPTATPVHDPTDILEVVARPPAVNNLMINMSGRGNNCAFNALVAMAALNGYKAGITVRWRSVSDVRADTAAVAAALFGDQYEQRVHDGLPAEMGGYPEILAAALAWEVRIYVCHQRDGVETWWSCGEKRWGHSDSILHLANNHFTVAVPDDADITCLGHLDVTSGRLTFDADRYFANRLGHATPTAPSAPPCDTADEESDSGDSDYESVTDTVIATPHPDISRPPTHPWVIYSGTDLKCPARHINRCYRGSVALSDSENYIFHCRDPRCRMVFVGDGPGGVQHSIGSNQCGTCGRQHRFNSPDGRCYFCSTWCKRCEGFTLSEFACGRCDKKPADGDARPGPGADTGEWEEVEAATDMPSTVEERFERGLARLVDKCGGGLAEWLRDKADASKFMREARRHMDPERAARLVHDVARFEDLAHDISERRGMRRVRIFTQAPIELDGEGFLGMLTIRILNFFRIEVTPAYGADVFDDMEFVDRAVVTCWAGEVVVSGKTRLKALKALGYTSSYLAWIPDESVEAAFGQTPIKSMVAMDKSGTPIEPNIRLIEQYLRDNAVCAAGVRRASASVPDYFRETVEMQMFFNISAYIINLLALRDVARCVVQPNGQFCGLQNTSPLFQQESILRGRL